MNLGRSLGRGGEGEVFEIAGHTDWVAKIYHQPVSTIKAQKLADMVSLATPLLLEIAAWPQATLSAKGSGQINGIVLPRITGAREIHELYSPAQRQVHFPNANWKYLVHTARNCAAAFATLHEHGIIVGDVNRGNVFVSQSALVRFIDCDSFQFSCNGHTHVCEVGVPHFTPPEIQGAKLASVVRTAHHDAFGLAVLIFHLLFMGRHPYAGRFLGQGDMPIEKAIRESRFAYGVFANAKQIQPPPFAITLDEVSAEVSQLFEHAFSFSIRPTPDQWASALQLLDDRLRKCSLDPGHVYFSRLHKCPWCEIERSGGPNLFISVTIQSIGSQGVRVDVAADLALLLETARDFAGAADYFLLAARNAAHVFANQEAVVLARRGVEVLASLPDTPERARKELALQITLGPALFATKDWTAPEVETAYTRAQVLCRELGESPDLFPALWGLFLFHIARGDPDGTGSGIAVAQPGPTRAGPGALPAGTSRVGTDLWPRRRLGGGTDTLGAGDRLL